MEQSMDVKTTIQQQFGRVATAYVESPTHAQADDLVLLVEWLAPKQDAVALDIATGGGHVAKALAPHVQMVYATDLTKPMLAAARTHLLDSGLDNVQYVLADAESLPFLDETFDIVTCRIAAHHFPNPHQFIGEVSRVLKPGGLFLFIDNIAPANEQLAHFLNTFEKMRDIGHIRCLTYSEWTQSMTEVGLQVVKYRLRKKLFQFRPWLHRMAQTKQQIATVERFFQCASENAKTYFNVICDEHGVQAFQMDECMILCQKTL